MTNKKANNSLEDIPAAADEKKEVVNNDSIQEGPAKVVYNKEELLAIFDEMIFSGEYTEEVLIKNRLKVRFKSRSVEDTTAISRSVDGKNFLLITTLSEHRALLNLAYSLVQYGETDLEQLSIDDRIKYLNKLPGVMASAVSQALSRFDAKISAACEEGEANF